MPTLDTSGRRGRTLRRLVGGAAALAIAGSTPLAATASTSEIRHPDQDVQTVFGELPDGAKYEIQLPSNWDGTLAVYSHGLVFPGQDNPVLTSPKPAVGKALLHDGIALAGSDFGATGWAVEEALRDQNALVDVVTEQFGRPARTIAWGESLGAMVSTGLVQRYPDRFDGAVPLCGVQAGAVGTWNHFLDTAFVLKTLLGKGAAFTVTDIADPLANFQAASQTFSEARSSAVGRARIALMAAIGQIPGAVDPDGPESEPTLEGRFNARVSWLEAPYLIIAFAERGELEARAGGNPSSNLGVDYRTMLNQSRQLKDVRAMYDAAGVSLRADLGALARAPRIDADEQAVEYLRANVAFRGDLNRPVFTLHNVADGALPSSQEQAFRAAVHSAGRSARLRQAFAGRPGHCSFTGAEMVVAFDKLLERVSTGKWTDTSPAALNAAALARGPRLNRGGGAPVPPAFVDHHPLTFPRPFTLP